MFSKSGQQTILASGERVVEVLDLQQAGRQELTVPEMPDAILPVLQEASQSFDEYKQLISVKKTRRLPRGQRGVYKQRIREIEAELRGAAKVINAIEAGYEPYSIPDSFYIGHVAEPWGSNKGIYLVFKAPMPSEVLDKYEAARKGKLFDTFLVASPDRDLFRSISPITVEPFLVGFVKIARELSFTDDKPNGGLGFLIAHWDLEKDLQFNRQN